MERTSTSQWTEDRLNLVNQIQQENQKQINALQFRAAQAQSNIHEPYYGDSYVEDAELLQEDTDPARGPDQSRRKGPSKQQSTKGGSHDAETSHESALDVVLSPSVDERGDGSGDDGAPAIMGAMSKDNVVKMTVAKESVVPPRRRPRPRRPPVDAQGERGLPEAQPERPAFPRVPRGHRPVPKIQPGDGSRGESASAPTSPRAPAGLARLRVPPLPPRPAPPAVFLDKSELAAFAGGPPRVLRTPPSTPPPRLRSPRDLGSPLAVPCSPRRGATEPPLSPRVLDALPASPGVLPGSPRVLPGSPRVAHARREGSDASALDASGGIDERARPAAGTFWSRVGITPVTPEPPERVDEQAAPEISAPMAKGGRRARRQWGPVVDPFVGRAQVEQQARDSENSDPPDDESGGDHDGRSGFDAGNGCSGDADDAADGRDARCDEIAVVPRGRRGRAENGAVLLVQYSDAQVNGRDSGDSGDACHADGVVHGRREDDDRGMPPLPDIGSSLPPLRRMRRAPPSDPLADAVYGTRPLRERDPPQTSDGPAPPWGRPLRPRARERSESELGFRNHPNDAGQRASEMGFRGNDAGFRGVGRHGLPKLWRDGRGTEPDLFAAPDAQPQRQQLAPLRGDARGGLRPLERWREERTEPDLHAAVGSVHDLQRHAGMGENGLSGGEQQQQPRARRDDRWRQEESPAVVDQRMASDATRQQGARNATDEITQSGGPALVVEQESPPDAGRNSVPDVSVLNGSDATNTSLTLDGGGDRPVGRRQSRLERAQQETLAAFGGASLWESLKPAVPARNRYKRPS